jgi:hypothetical protein
MAAARDASAARAVAVRPARISNNQNGGWGEGSNLNSRELREKSRTADQKMGTGGACDTTEPRKPAERSMPPRFSRPA